MRKLLIASALLAVSAGANAAVYDVTLTEHLIGRAGNPPSVTLINPDGGAPTCTFDDSNNELSCSGVFNFRSQTNPTPFGRIFDRYITDLNIVGGSAAGTTAYDCIDGGFSQAVGASFCGNITWGANFTNESTVTYGPGLAFSRAIGGDDVSAGDQQSINDYNLVVSSFTGSGGVLVLQSADWNPTSSAGTQLTFEVAVIPVPAAVWLFGSALGLLGLARRRLAA